MRRTVILTGALAFALAIPAGGCGGNDDNEQAAAKGVFVGKVSGSDAYVALVSNGDKLVGYLCNGKKVSVWLEQLKLKGETADLLNRKGDTIGSATLASDEATGDIEIEGKAHSFTASLAEGKAGLYHEEKGKPGKAGFEETGWIVLADGSVRGSRAIIRGQGPVIPPKPPGPVAGTQSTPSTGFIEPITSN